MKKKIEIGDAVIVVSYMCMWAFTMYAIVDMARSPYVISVIIANMVIVIMLIYFFSSFSGDTTPSDPHPEHAMD